MIDVGKLYGILEHELHRPNSVKTRHSHRHSPRRAQGLSHVTIKAKFICDPSAQNQS